MKIYAVVEGQGEVSAVRVLLRRFVELSGLFTVGVGVPLRRKQHEFFREDDLKRAVSLAANQEDCGGILVLFDGEDVCPAEWGPKVQIWAEAAARGIPCQVVIAYREYESWFLAALQSLRGRCSISAGATNHSAPEARRNAKGELDRVMEAGASYSPTVHQQKLTAALDLEAAYRGSRSFRKLAKAIGVLLANSDERPLVWPPSAWTI